MNWGESVYVEISGNNIITNQFLKLINNLGSPRKQRGEIRNEGK